jgi:hypothetical protein
MGILKGKRVDLRIDNPSVEDSVTYLFSLRQLKGVTFENHVKAPLIGNSEIPMYAKQDKASTANEQNKPKKSENEGRRKNGVTRLMEMMAKVEDERKERNAPSFESR